MNDDITRQIGREVDKLHGVVLEGSWRWTPVADTLDVRGNLYRRSANLSWLTDTRRTRLNPVWL